MRTPNSLLLTVFVLAHFTFPSESKSLQFARLKRQGGFMPDFSNLFGNAFGPSVAGSAGGQQQLPGTTGLFGTTSGTQAFGTGQTTANNIGLGPGGFSTGQNTGTNVLGSQLVNSGSSVGVGSNGMINTNEGTSAFGSGFNKGTQTGFTNGGFTTGTNNGVSALGKSLWSGGDTTSIGLTPGNAGGCTGKSGGVFGSNLFQTQDCMSLPFLSGLAPGGSGGSGSGGGLFGGGIPFASGFGSFGGFGRRRK